MANFSIGIVPEAEKELQVFTGSDLSTWTLFTNGSSNVKVASLCIVLIPPSREIIRQAIKCHPITKNEAEYEAVIAGLELERELRIEQIIIKADSQLIKRITSTPYHPVANGQAKSTNKVIINNLKKRLEESKCKWLEVLLGVLWAYQTTARTGTGETPFSLVYGAEAIIPVEIGEPRTRYTQVTEESNEEDMRINLDLLKEKRKATLIRMAAQK
ncbi:uncharacterized protein [Nicotiana sylvestris]|uniref:uncharacterized protein n=1 Tax=Nicotiana sylvestris TaxID=4096 RepID=UPI00388C4E03